MFKIFTWAILGGYMSLYLSIYLSTYYLSTYLPAYLYGTEIRHHILLQGKSWCPAVWRHEVSRQPPSAKCRLACATPCPQQPGSGSCVRVSSLVQDDSGGQYSHWCFLLGWQGCVRATLSSTFLLLNHAFFPSPSQLLILKTSVFQVLAWRLLSEKPNPQCVRVCVCACA